MSVELVIRLVAMLLAALATGGLMVNWVGLARAMARISSASAYTEFHQATNRTFDPYMPIVVFGALFGGIALAVVSGVNSAAGQLAILGAVGLVTTLGSIFLSLVPADDNPNKLLAVVKVVGLTLAMVAAGVWVYWRESNSRDARSEIRDPR